MRPIYPIALIAPYTKKIYIFLFIYCLIWTFAPALLASSVALDVSEGVNWGREWQWGYYKHPPLSSWVLYSFYRAFGDVGIYALSQLCVFGSVFLTYQLGKQFFSKNAALLGALLLLMVGYYSYPSLEFNHNVAQLPIWAGLLYSFYLATLTSSTANSGDKKNWYYWLMFAVLGGAGMLTKYHVIFLLTSMAIYLLLPNNRHWLKSPKPWVAAIVMLAIFSPHLIWLVQNHWLPFSYAESRIATKSAVEGHLSWLGFLGSQALVHVPLLIGVAWAAKNTLNPKALPNLPKSLFNIKNFSDWQNSPYFYLIFMTAVPVALVISCSVILGMGLRDMWGMPMWNLSGLLAVAWLSHRIGNKGEENGSEAMWDKVTPRLLNALKIWLILISVIMIIMLGFSQQFSKRPARMQYPQLAIAKQTAQTWQHISNCPLDSLAGDRWYTALAAMKLPQFTHRFPSLVIGGDMTISPWMTPQRLHEQGTLIIQATSSQKVGEIAPLGVPALMQMLDKDATLRHFSGDWQFGWQGANATPPLALHWTAYVPVSCVKPT